VKKEGEPMKRAAFQVLVKVSLLTAALLVLSASLADSPKRPLQETNKDRTEKRTGQDAEKEFRREAEKLVGEICLEVLSDDKWTRAERIEQALLYYSDPTRNNDRGSVWGWGQKGRPLALLELFQSMTDRTRWAFAVCNTSGRKLRATRAGKPWWRENDSAAELKDIPGAPAASPEAAPRQRQLKQLAQKFTGHQFWDPDNTRYELRRLERPLLTYRDEAGGVLEGGLFTLANGTNPEIMFFIEARVDPKDSKKAVWRYTVGRLAHAELHMQYDGKEVFSAPRGDRVSAADRPYWLDFVSKPPAIEREKE
jgi:hypothetical protein